MSNIQSTPITHQIKIKHMKNIHPTYRHILFTFSQWQESYISMKFTFLHLHFPGTMKSGMKK